MQAGTKKKPAFYKVRTLKGQATTTIRAGTLRDQLCAAIKAYGKRGAPVVELETNFDRPLRTTLHKLIEFGHIEPIWPKVK